MFSGQIFGAIGSILLILIVDSSGKVIQFKNCGPDVIQTVEIDPCTEEPCTFKKGLPEHLKLTFTSAGTGVTGIKVKAHGIVLGQEVPYPIPKSDGCVSCNLTCPLQPGTHVYLNDITTPKEVPNMRLVVKWELVDQNDADILCFEFPISVSS